MSTEMTNTEVSLSHPQALIHYPVVVSKPVQHWRLIHSATQEEFNFDVEAKARFKVDDLHTAMNAVLAGIGIGLFPVAMVAPYIAAGKLQIVLPEWQGRQRPVYLLYRDRVNMPHRLRLLIDFILEQIPAEIHYRGQSC
jgi:LysR family transcriptional regulator AphB